MADKYCKDCRWFHPSGRWSGMACERPIVSAENIRLVWGNATQPLGAKPRIERGDGECGLVGKFWEAKEGRE